MCTAVALTRSELPLALIDAHQLDARAHHRGGTEPDIRFAWTDRERVLPVWWQGQLRILRWGSRGRQDRTLPPTGWTWRASVEAGKWDAHRAERVEVPATFILTNGVWIKVREGVHGLVVRDGQGEPVVYLICEESTRYYSVMTRAEWMPWLIGEIL